jgi:hypothetical protein
MLTDYADDAMVAVHFRHPIVPETNHFATRSLVRLIVGPLEKPYGCCRNLGLFVIGELLKFEFD